MLILAKLIGLFVTALGLAVFASPQITRKILDFFKEDQHIYYAGIARALIGLVLLLAASGSLVPVAAVALGIVFLISGIIVLAGDMEKTKTFLAHYSELNPLVLRLFGLIAASFGILIYSVI